MGLIKICFITYQAMVSTLAQTCLGRFVSLRIVLASSSRNLFFLSTIPFYWGDPGEEMCVEYHSHYKKF